MLNSAITSLIKRLEKAEAFVLEQAPEICKEIVIEGNLDARTNLTKAGLLFVVSLAATITFAIISYNTKAECSFFTGAASLGSLATVMCASEAIIGEVNMLLTIKRCPKLYLLRELRKLIK